MHANHNNKGTPTLTPTTKTITTTATKPLLRKEGKGQGVQVKGEVLQEKWSTFGFSKNVRVNMESSNSISGGFLGNILVLDQHAKAAFKMPVTDAWGVAGSTQVKIRTSHTVRIIIGLLFLFIITGLVLNYRIQSLEERNSALESQLTDLQSRLRSITYTVTQLQEKQNVPVPTDLSKNNYMTDDNSSWVEENYEDSGTDFVEEGADEDYEASDMTENVRRLRRSVESSETAMVLPLRGIERINGSSIPFPAFKNLPATPTQPGMQQPSLFRYGSSAQPVPMGNANRKRERGKENKRNESQKFSKLSVSKMRRQRKRDTNNIAKLKLKLEIARTQSKSYTALAKELLKSSTSTFSAPHHDPRAAYLTVRDPNINIEHPEQLIGPWYIAESGSDIGFNDLWYHKLALDDNGTSVMFQESGLYLIYAQVFYKSVTKINERPAPMGFRIYLKKNQNVPKPVFRQPIPIAECVPSYPSTFYQTCFTQICWFVEQGDEVYLEHFTDAKPIIEAEKMGQTFLGIVRLSP